MYLMQADKSRQSQQYGVISQSMFLTDQDENSSASLMPSNIWDTFWEEEDAASLAYSQELTFPERNIRKKVNS